MHFYTETKTRVEPRHFVPMKSDPSRTRPSRTSDAKAALKQGEVWYPSVTTFLGVLDKPALLNWKIDQHLTTAFLMPLDKVIGLGMTDYLSEVKRLTQEAMDVAPQAGTDFHKVMEDCFNEGIFPENEIEAKAAKSIITKIQEKCGDAAIIECEKYFINSEDGYGGCADLIVGDWVIDYKTKQTADRFKPGKMAYPEHSRQLAAYGMALGKTKAANIFICLENGEIEFHEHDDESLSNGWLDFQACVGIYNRSRQ